MFRTKHLIATAAVVALSAAPASAATWEDLKPDGSQASPPPSSIAAQEGQAYEELRSPSQDLRSADAQDAAAHRGLYAVEDKTPYVLNRDYGSPDVVDAARELPPVELPAPVVSVADTPSGFDWGDAGIGAAGMLALFSMAAGSALLITGRRRRRGLRVAMH
jgi:hypothetical protein